MIEIYPNVFCGDQHDFDGVKGPMGIEIDGWYVLHCCKEPYHREFLDYATRGAPKDHPEYLFARRGNRMALNMVDAKSPEFFSKEMITAGLDFLEEGHKAGKKLLIHCNEGRSRSCGTALLFLTKRILKSDKGFSEMEAELKTIYPMMELGEGIRGHLMQFWGEY